jgi:predicted DNA-binding protein with PD1-like motif
LKYLQGKTGRVFVARLDHGDDLLGELKLLAEREKVEAAVLYVIGALKEASLVVGPEECSLPPVPVWRKFDDCREIVGVGTMFRDREGQPVFHLHGAIGRGDACLMGCVRGESEVYLVAEVIILELLDTGAMKDFDPASGLKMLTFLP